MKPNPDTLPLLMAARILLTPAENWAQGNRGEDEDGFYTDGDAPDAVRWCALGALDAFTGERSEETAAGRGAISALAGVGKYDDQAVYDVADRNNHSTHEQVLAMYDVAITRVEGAL